MAPSSALLLRNTQCRLLSTRASRLVDISNCCACVNAVPLAPSCPRFQPTAKARSRRRLFSSRANDARFELQQTLIELQQHAPNLVSLPRLQLALQGLRQSAGAEVVRIAILGLADGSEASSTSSRVLRALLADPLQEEQAWERQFQDRIETKPLIVRVGPSQKHAVSLEIEKQAGPNEMHISSPQLDSYNLEFLVLEYDAPSATATETSPGTFEEAILVPNVQVPSDRDGVALMATPVHQSLLIADGLKGAVSIAALPTSKSGKSVSAAVQIEGGLGLQAEPDFQVIDVSQAEQGIRVFRQGPQYALDYERLWYASNISNLMEWIKSTSAPAENATKPAVRSLVASLLRNTSRQIQLQEAKKSSRALTARYKDPADAALQKRLTDWAQQAHSELQDELDLAFKSRRWRKLGWWKLFWRVDDVTMLTSELLSRQFLPTTERELIHLTGRIAQSRSASPIYPQPRSAEEAASELHTPDLAASQPLGTDTPPSVLPKWPGHIAFTRRYLQNETVPALQSLAQKLVLQSLGTTGIASAVTALLYMSSFAPTLYEAGTVAALGIVYSLGRMQKSWNAARTFWAGEVHEEGRKAIRAAEESVASVLAGDASHDDIEESTQELTKAKELVSRAQGALSRLK